MGATKNMNANRPEIHRQEQPTAPQMNQVEGEGAYLAPPNYVSAVAQPQPLAAQPRAVQQPAPQGVVSGNCTVVQNGGFRVPARQYAHVATPIVLPRRKTVSPFGDTPPGYQRYVGGCTGGIAATACCVGAGMASYGSYMEAAEAIGERFDFDYNFGSTGDILLAAGGGCMLLGCLALCRPCDAKEDQPVVIQTNAPIPM